LSTAEPGGILVSGKLSKADRCRRLQP